MSHSAGFVYKCFTQSFPIANKSSKMSWLQHSLPLESLPLLLFPEISNQRNMFMQDMHTNTLLSTSLKLARALACLVYSTLCHQSVLYLSSYFQRYPTKETCLCRIYLQILYSVLPSSQQELQHVLPIAHSATRVYSASPPISRDIQPTNRHKSHPNFQPSNDTMAMASPSFVARQLSDSFLWQL